MVIRESGVDQLEELRISLEAEGDATFLEASGHRTTFRIPFSREEIEGTLTGTYGSRQSIDPLMSLGTTLFQALFAGPVGRTLWEKMSQVDDQNRGLRLRILTNLERIEHLPWELLFDPSRGDFMSLSGRLALVRTRPDGHSFENPLPLLTRLRILAVEADPLGSMATREDLNILKGVARENPGRIEVETVERATVDKLREVLTYGAYEVFHFAGTGEVLPYVGRRGVAKQALRLLGPSPLFDRRELGRLLEKAGVRLAVLNACHTDWVARSQARYIPAVIGLREELDAKSCLALCRAFYQSVASGSGLDLAVTAARQAVDRTLPGGGDWCKVIFYLQQPNGVLLEGRASVFDDAPAPETTDKESLKLRRLLEIHRQNLDALMRGAYAVPVPDSIAAQSDDLRRKIEEIEKRLGLAKAK